MTSEKQALDDLVNSYLFEVGLYESPKTQQAMAPFQETRKEISLQLRQLSLSELQELQRQYTLQKQEMLEEIQWRGEHGKSRNIPLELAYKALVDILDEIGRLLDPNPSLSYTTDSSLFLEEDLPSLKEDLPSLKEENIIDDPEDVLDEIEEAEDWEEISSFTMEAIDDSPSSSKAASGYTSRKPSMDSSKSSKSIQKRAPLSSSSSTKSSLSARRKTSSKTPITSLPKKSSKAHQTKSCSSPKTSSSSSLTSHLSKEENPLSPPGTNPEERIRRYVTDYLQNFRSISWQKRDQQEEQRKHIRFQKEKQQRKELEQFRQQKQFASQKLRKDKRKKWWFQ